MSRNWGDPWRQKRVPVRANGEDHVPFTTLGPQNIAKPSEGGWIVVYKQDPFQCARSLCLASALRWRRNANPSPGRLATFSHANGIGTTALGLIPVSLLAAASTCLTDRVSDPSGQDPFDSSAMRYLVQLHFSPGAAETSKRGKTMSKLSDNLLV